MAKRALVTGATGAIGRAIARQLAERGFEVVLGCRNAAEAEALARELEGARAELLDQADPASIAALGERWSGPLDVLIVNASDTPRERRETDEGVEVQWATNVLGYARLVNALLPALERAEDARVVFVASYWAGDLDLDDPQFRTRRYDNDTAYRQSKQAERMLAAGLAPRLRERGVTINACHPGDVNSALSNSLGFGGSQTPDEGADTPVWLAADPSVAGASGGWFSGRRRSACRFSDDAEGVAQLLALVESHG